MGDIPAYNLENLEVVYVEQFPHIRSMVRSVLGELGIRKIRDTSSLDDAHDMIIDHPPDFIITDWGPDFDGLKLVDWVRKGTDSPNRFTPSSSLRRLPSAKMWVWRAITALPNLSPSRWRLSPFTGAFAC